MNDWQRSCRVLLETMDINKIWARFAIPTTITWLVWSTRLTGLLHVHPVRNNSHAFAWTSAGLLCTCHWCNVKYVHLHACGCTKIRVSSFVNCFYLRLGTSHFQKEAWLSSCLDIDINAFRFFDSIRMASNCICRNTNSSQIASNRVGFHWDVSIPFTTTHSAESSTLSLRRMRIRECHDLVRGFVSSPDYV